MIRLIKKIFCVCFLISLILFSSCKKDKKSAAAPATNTTNGSALYDGILRAWKSQDVIGTTLDTYIASSGDAWFGSAPSEYYTNYNFVKVDSIFLNGTRLSFGSYDYTDSTYSISNMPPAIWHIVGNNGIPSFNFTNTSAMPSYSGYATFPDSIDRAQTITVAISGITNATNASFYITDGTYTAYKALSINGTSVTFNPTDLSSLAATPYGYIEVVVGNETVQTFGGKKFKFQNEYQVTKFIKIK